MYGILCERAVIQDEKHRTGRGEMIAKLKVSEKVLREAMRQEIHASEGAGIEHRCNATPIFDYDYECFLVGGEPQAIMFLLGRLAALGEDGLILVQP